MAPIKHKSYYNFLPLRFLYVIVYLLIGIYWPWFRALPTYLFSHCAVIWILHLYRGVNKYKTSVENEFFISFWVRMGWGTCYTYYNTGHLYTDRDAFALTIVECFLVTAIFTALPLHYV